MNIQTQFNQEALNMLPNVMKEVALMDSHNENQARNYILRECMNSITPIISMTQSQLEAFQDELIRIFIYFRWIKE